ncbi:protein FAM32A-like [Mytilus californianus]|uniref:protein FAM32A-like n=1 Tax=Mytilus californianus TaxID=6549 RepID=UPI0022460862|nr:protein FAM32A-like [Mytilus californianus]
MSEYENVGRGSLKLKGVSDHSIKKKKKKRDKEKDAQKMFEQISNAKKTNEGDSSSHIIVDKRTKAEIAFEKARENRKAEQIIEKASKTHKERIMDFNKHLDNLTEHFDIPKVSWTK